MITDGKIVNQAAREIGDGVDDCLVCEHTKKVVTRWDIVMKPWKTGNYLFARNTRRLVYLNQKKMFVES